MRHTVVVLGAAIAALLMPATDGHQLAPAITSTTVELPSGDALFPGGANADAINNNCLACHSADMVLNQPALSRSAWDAEVHKMIKAYKAPIDESDVSAIVDYLASTKGTN
ncbi:sulfite:cytochrome C oxidoreductase subunit b precursor [Bradyrhizobium sp. WSM3983]|uniref:sulfite:cytochrome C oxidoreductase subunit b precursor n=1 Tax=Bradyrhizobium sp. WSM3983 TaxID=1038867 RepID=UPI000489BF34|nr:sulfite:cytochrome C oxidoreductase subunit b precursor [Bradyrhizobium sp. WSM3983]